MILRYKPFIITNPSAEYRQISPSGDLSGIIDCYWFSYVNENPVKNTLVIPDNCVDLIYKFGADGKKNGRNFIGMMSRTEEFLPRKGEGMFGIRFLPYTVNLLFDHDMSSFRDRSIFMEDISEAMPLVSKLNFIESMPRNQRDILRIEEVIRRSLHCDRKKVNSEISEIIETVYERGLYLNAEQVASGKFYSLSHINRLFRREVGISLKTFMRVNRFQKILRSMRSSGSEKLLELAIEHGFYDQSHFIREFKYFLNESPSKKTISFYNTGSRDSRRIELEGE